MQPKHFKLVISLDSAALIVMVLGLLLMVTACGGTKPISNDTVKTHTETENRDTTYKSKDVDIKVKGEKKLVVGDSLDVHLNDSIPVVINNPCDGKRDTVYIKPILPKQKLSVNIESILVFNRYGYSKAWVKNNKLYLTMDILEQTIRHRIDSAIVEINIDKVIKDTEFKTEVRVKKEIMSGVGTGLGVILALGFIVLLAYKVIKFFVSG